MGQTEKKKKKKTLQKWMCGAPVRVVIYDRIVTFRYRFRPAIAGLEQLSASYLTLCLLSWTDTDNDKYDVQRVGISIYDEW